MVVPWYTLFGLLFLIPFVDPRRPFRLLHLNLVLLLVTGVGPLLAELGAGQPWGSLALTVLELSYLAVRFLLLGLGPARAREPLVPLLTAQVSVAALALLLAFVPRGRSVWQLTALGAGIMAALQLTMNYWSDGYLLWLAPLAFAACFAAYDCRPEVAFWLGERGKAGAASAEIPDSQAEEVV